MAGTGGIQVLRFATRKTLDIHLVRHIEGRRRHPTTRTTATIDRSPACVDLGGVGLAAARVAVERHWPTGRGRKPHQALDMVFAGPPPYVIPVRDQDGKVTEEKDENGELRPLYKPNPDRWSPERELKWAKSIAGTLPELVGDESVVASVSLHRDELSPHLQAVVVPVRDGKLGWCRVRDGAAARLAPQVKEARGKAISRGEDAPKLSTRTRYGVLQDALYYRVSRQFGLSRGQVGSEATHLEIDRAAAAEAREGQALYEAEQARAAATEAAADADASRRTRNEYHDEAVENMAAAREARQERAAAERERDTARTEGDRAVGDLEAFHARGPWVRRVRQERELRQREQVEAERRAELGHKESELKEREEQVATDAAAVEQRQANLAAGESKLEEDQAAVATKRRQTDEACETAEAVFRAATRRRAKLKSLALEVRDGRKELAHRKADFAAEQEAFDPARRKLAADRRDVEEREEAVQAKETALRSDQATVVAGHKRLTMERDAAGKIGARTLRGQRDLAAQRERAKRRDEELGEWARQLDAQHDSQEKHDEQHERTAANLAARTLELDAGLGRLQRQRERLLAMLLRCREKARRLRSWARQLVERQTGLDERAGKLDERESGIEVRVNELVEERTEERKRELADWAKMWATVRADELAVERTRERREELDQREAGIEARAGARADELAAERTRERREELDQREARIEEQVRLWAAEWAEVLAEERTAARIGELDEREAGLEARERQAQTTLTREAGLVVREKAFAQREALQGFTIKAKVEEQTKQARNELGQAQRERAAAEEARQGSDGEAMYHQLTGWINDTFPGRFLELRDSFEEYRSEDVLSGVRAAERARERAAGPEPKEKKRSSVSER